MSDPTPPALPTQPPAPAASAVPGPVPATPPTPTASVTAPLDGTGREFLRSQVAALGPHDFFIVASPDRPIDAVEVAKDHAGALVVRVPPRLTGEALPVPSRSLLVERGFASPDPASPAAPWEHLMDGADADAVLDLALATLRDVFSVELGATFDIAHGNHAGEWDAHQRLDRTRQVIEPVLEGILGRVPEKDEDGDYLVPSGDVQVWVAPRVMPGAPVVIRVFAITNVGVELSPELGLFLARLNFGLMFGRFALDTDHRAVWFDETLLGDATTPDALRFTIDVVANTARQWDDKLEEMFGGTTHVDLRNRPEHKPDPPTKPGQAGYL